MDGRTGGGRTFETHLIRSTRRSRPKKSGKDRACGSGRYSRGQTDTQKDTHRRGHHNTSPPLPRAK